MGQSGKIISLSLEASFKSMSKMSKYGIVGRDDSAGTVVDSIEKFDVDTEEWSHGPVGTCTTPVPMYGQCSVRLGEKIYLVGGLNSKTNYLASTFSFSPASGQWTVEQNLQQARVHHACASLGGGILVAGGSISGRYLDSAEWWNPATQTWQWAGQMMVPREYHSLSVRINSLIELLIPQIFLGFPEYCNCPWRFLHFWIYKPLSGQSRGLHTWPE